MALAVGMGNSNVEFVFPTSKEVGHPSFDVSPSTGACGNTIRVVVCVALVSFIFPVSPGALADESAPEVASTDLRFRLLTIEGATRSGTIARATADDLTINGDDGSERTLAYDELLQLESTARRSDPPPKGALNTLHLADGGRLLGEITGATDDGITVVVPTLGGTPRRLSFEALAGIRLFDQPHKRAEEVFTTERARRVPGHDVVILVRDGQVHTFKGSIESLAPADPDRPGRIRGRFQVGDQEVELNPQTLYAIVFASGLDEVAPGPMTLDLTTGERVTGRLRSADPERFTFAHGQGAPTALPWSRCRRITFRNPRVAFLSDLEPTAVHQTPYLNVSWPMRLDRSVANHPLRLGGKTYPKGLGMHSACRVTYQLGDGYRQFAADVGIDDAVRPRGSVVFRVLTDGKERFQSGEITGRDDPKTILVDIAGATTLTLVVDFGQDADLGDHADWAGARVIK